MTDTITESFCERCGTRYSFEQPVSRRRGGIGRVRALTRGLKTYVANDGMPMTEAMAAARDEEERSAVFRQLEAFHKTFNFCMSCRQYTCPNCWNEKAGECLTCAPDVSREILPAPFPELPAAGPAGGGNGHRGQPPAAPMAWPTVDLDRATVPGYADSGGVEAAPPPLGLEPEPEVELETDPEVLARLESMLGPSPSAPAEELTAKELAEIESALAAAQASGVGAPSELPTPTRAIESDAVTAPIVGPPEPAAGALEPAAVPPDAAAEPAREAAAATAATPADAMDLGRGQTKGLLGRFRLGRPTAAPAPAGVPTTEGPAVGLPAAEDVQPAVGEADLAATAGAATPTPVPEPEPEAAPVAAAELGTPGPEPAPTPEPVAAEAPAPEPAPTPEPVAAEAPEPGPMPADHVPQPTWRVVAPEATTPAEPAPEPAWPATPAWPAPPPAADQGPLPGPNAAPWAARLATSRPEPANLWAASSQEVLGAAPSAGARPVAPVVQACVSCGLSLSANARFCRRCGTRQA